MFDGVDAVRDPGERHVLLELNYEWSSDGETLSIVVPAQIMDIVYINQLNNLINVTAENEYKLIRGDQAGIIYPGKWTRLSSPWANLPTPLDEPLDVGTYTFQIICCRLPLLMVHR